MRVFVCKGCALLLLLSSLASAQGSPLTFEQVVDLVMLRSPLLGAERASQRAAEALVQQAGASPNPYIQLQSQSDGFERLSLLGLAVSKPFELGHKRQARVRVAESEKQEAHWQMEARQLSLRREVRERFLLVLLAQGKERIAGDLAHTTARHLEIARQRLRQGDVSGQEVHALEVEAQRREAQRALAAGERQKALASLGEHLFGEEDPLAAGVTGELGWRFPLPALDSLVTGLDSASLRLAEARTQTQDSRIALERARGVSDLTVQAGVFVQRDYFPGGSFSPQGVVRRLDDTGPLLQLQLQIPLPIGDDNSGNIAAAQARAEQTSLEREALERKVLAEIAGVYHSLAARQQARRLLEEQVLPESQRVMDTVERAYAMGFRSQVDLLLARESYLRSAEDALQAAYSESLAAAELEQLLGRPLPTESESHE